MEDKNKFGTVGILTIYYILNAIAFSISIVGDRVDGWWLPAFILTNVVGISNTWVLMQLYKRMNVNTATAVALGGGFLITQIATAVIFASHLAVLQYLGLALIAAGLFAMVKGENKNKEEVI